MVSDVVVETQAKQMFLSLFYNKILILSRGYPKKMKNNSQPMPLTSYLEAYGMQGMLRAHMPGHKGRSIPGFSHPSDIFAWDITEISGADSLFEADGILHEAEQRTAEIYGSPACCWSAGGSTLCIQAMLAHMRSQGRTVIAARTVHRAFLNACILLGLSVRWVFPRNGGMISGEYAPEDFAAALQNAVNAGESPCVYVTSPDYLGHQLDIAGLAALCHTHGAPLLVDNAHGAHLAFLRENRHPIALGADYCCDSAHKMLPALTGAALLHCRKPEEIPALKSSMQLFGSTSPSYLIMQSLESCTAYLAMQGREEIRRCAEHAEELRRKFADQFEFVGTDPLHLTIAANGHDLAAQMRRLGVECEYEDEGFLVLLLSPVMTQAEFIALEHVLRRCTPKAPRSVPALPAPMEAACDMRTAALSGWELVPLPQAEGRICGPVQVPCPPAVPIAVSGERLTKPWLDLMAYYGLSEAAVML